VLGYSTLPFGNACADLTPESLESAEAPFAG
jgi:hypothetical protein